VVERSAQLAREAPGGDVRKAGGIDLATIQKHLNFWFSVSLDLFGGEKSSNAADYFASGLKGREREERYPDHLALEGTYPMDLVVDGRLVTEQVPIRNAMNEILRDGYVEDCDRGVQRWNKTLEKYGMSERLSLPHRRFHRNIGAYAGAKFDTTGRMISEDEWNRRRDEWLPSPADREYVQSLMHAVNAPGKIANWVAAPPKGINGQPFEFEYVRHH
jgi:benzoyl-CoA 2,3-dioxygenase component B